MCVLAAMKVVGIGFLLKVSIRIVFAAFTCIFALEGGIVGTVVGAMKDQTTEIGFLKGAGIGAVAFKAVQLLESLAYGVFIKGIVTIYLMAYATLLISLVNGNVFIDWVSPASSASSLDSMYREIADIYDVNGAKGLSRSCIQKLPMHEFRSSEQIKWNDLDQPCCSICLQGLKDGELARNLPRCGHIFRLECIDERLRREGTCPMCGEHVFNDVEELAKCII
ncbi:Endoribonuclease L-PSP family protein [Hibiscus syriacus]|uniref:Endoribonuclease L-PSP family protein n=1 Tax=Hibiscus syriacus TaxID=106335 RepID=A0A6A3CYJ4_HIBSY|nr:Endoribonuclease L-PSP family protein [Hibiscus syriacus]